MTDDIENQIYALLQLQNDLRLIKLTKDGKIYNYKQIEKEWHAAIQSNGDAVQRIRRLPAAKTNLIPMFDARDAIE